MLLAGPDGEAARAAVAREPELRDNLTVYDAAYGALAERLETSLVTVDRRLTEASGPRARS